MRKLLIRGILPLVFAALPVAATFGLIVSLPPEAREFFALHITRLDWIILGSGAGLLAWQTIALWIGLATYNARGGPGLIWLRQLAGAVEWFPLLGLLGTVISILQTLGNLAPGTPIDEVIRNYSPALTATASGLVAALANLMPLWTGNLAILMFDRIAEGPTPDSEGPSGAAGRGGSN